MWSFDLRVAGQSGVQEVQVDAGDGKVLCVKHETPQQEAATFSLMRDLGVTEGDISATTGHSIAVMRAVYSHPLPKERRGGTDDCRCARELAPNGRRREERHGNCGKSRRN
jgi:hypothetical protein